MKQALIPKPELKQQTSFNRSQKESLKILSLSHDELKLYLMEQMNQNPFLHVQFKEMDDDAFLAYDHSKTSLREELMNQLQLMNVRYQKDLCEQLISTLDSNGYFKYSKKELLSMCGCNESEFNHHINLLCTLEPIGCFAFDLRDCIRIQCKASEDPNANTAVILCDYLEELALKRFENISQKSQLSLTQIQSGFHFIQSCNPKPAANYNTDTIYMTPEFRIEVEEEKIQIISLHQDLSLSLNEQTINTKEMSQYLRNQRAQAKDLMNSVQKRTMTLTQIMNAICFLQSEFFLHHSSLHHLTLEMVAQQCGLHISTISRAIVGKSFEFENTYYSFKKMFVNGGIDGISQEEIKKRIVSIIETEDKKHPYSDEAIKKILEKTGVSLSRRAIAKYRDACFLYNSSKRKLL